ncbi:right-handed parallel beta-helix repeat-containing protein [Paenibacillus sp. JSM ZJ436]|uniref:right-handed parallel beta-helix repeat-containing protein n=1 Tax=Paenibacillus sp. JSM ZJ436 TaxID=3376190 RepID=UPI0037ADDCD9
MKIKYLVSSALVVTLTMTATLTGALGKAQAQSGTQSYSASAGYSSTAGQDLWRYQKLSGTVFSDLGYNSATRRWDHSGSYPWVSSNAGHPGKDFDSVRTWVAPADGKISISGTVAKGDSLGDGIRAIIQKDSVKLWSAHVTSKAEVTPSGVSEVPVKQGAKIHFIINRVNSINNDHTLWNPRVDFTPAQSPAAGISDSSGAAAETPPVNHLNVEGFGAVANDNKDDYAAFVAALDQAKKEGKSVYVPAGSFQLSRILTLDGVSLKGAGPQVTTLISTNPENGSIDMKGVGVQLRDLKHTYSTVVPRGNGANEKNSITVRGASQFLIDNVYVYKASTAGILVQGQAKQGVISNNRVEATNADGIHVTDGSSYITVSGNTVKGVGDDTIAVVSYLQDGAAVHHVTIKDNDTGYGSKARGIAVVGGFHVDIQGNSVKDTDMAGIYIAVEGSYNTANVNYININNNVVDHTGISAPQKHPNALVYASQGSIDNVTFSNNMFRNAAHRGLGVWGDGNIKNIYFTNNTLINSVGANTTFSNGIIHLMQNIGF